MKWCALNMNEGRRQMNCCCDEYWLHFPWTNNPRGLRGSLLFIVTLLLCCCGHCTSCCVCAYPPQGVPTRRTALAVCACGGALCAAPVCFSLFHLCVGVAAGLCVCACCRGLECVSCVVCGVRCMPGCCPLLMWCALCVCLPHLSSPLLLSMSLTVQISSTPLNDHTHDDDDVPSAVRPVGACPVLLPLCVCGRASDGSFEDEDE
ncbi:hypothetical protein ECC02_008721 [Trypanosoma cruzi]|uniref:Mucin TcMUC n=1 Tax=Trypanosoma cruzi TaxID=5693 RepID=A0A7J6XWH3_TRYCR|nr:hypothetical protein ECC02_008721 [Trypanosoma cruzi]